MSVSVDVNSILKDLKTLNDNNVIDVFLPSVGKPVKFKKLNIKQQKSLVMVALDNATSQLNFSIALYDIIQDNLIDCDITNLTLFDKNSIAFTLLEDNATSKSEPSKETLGEIVKRYKCTIKPQSLNIDIPNGVIHIETPSLYTDYRFNKTLHTKYTGDVENTKKFVDDVYLIELSKYIKSIEFSNGTIVKLLDYQLADFLNIVENLPSMSKIVQFINAIKDYETKLNTVKKDTININPSLFI